MILKYAGYGGINIVRVLKTFYGDYKKNQDIWGNNTKVLLLTDGQSWS